MSDKMIVILILGLSGLILGIIAAIVAKRRENYKFSPAIPKWAAIGLCLGIIVAVATKKIVAVGSFIWIGLAIGAVVSHRDQKRERTIQSNK